ncbi:hypothetical protein KQI18_00440 [Clostridioides mangenotii]|uniref:hypothetical protein n=1 Tax=Metaclostridioides mangenotii TaxID=1540 RepID=UPI001C11D7E3|nr:hypothetical protein [Clostridioides mangenotii]MBU5306239.1 hypothetical protein [Clostridioides mangenotii]
MRTKIILLITLASLLFVGCSFNNKEVDYFELGTQQLEDHKYKEAMSSFSTVLDDDDTNQSAKAMYLQAMRMSKALKFEKEENYQSAIKQLGFIAKIKNGSPTIKSEAAKMNKKFKKIVEDEKNDKESRKDNAKNSAKDDISRVEHDAANAQYGIRVKENKNKNHNNSNGELSSNESSDSRDTNSGGPSESNTGGSPESGGSNGSTESGNGQGESGENVSPSE